MNRGEVSGKEVQKRLKSQESDHSRDNDGCVSHRSRVVVAETSESETAPLSEVGQTTMLRTSINFNGFECDIEQLC